MKNVLITSYCNINKPVNGRSRRMKALLETFAEEQVLCEPAPENKQFSSVVYKTDLGKKKMGINWGIFNLYVPATISLIRKLIKTQQPKAIIMTSIWDFYPIKRVKIPKILDAHNVDATAIEERFGGNHFFSKLVAKAEKSALLGSVHICCCSPEDKKGFIAKYGIEPEKISVVPNGVDLSIFNSVSAEIPTEWKDKLDGYKILLFMGKLDYQPNKEALKFINETLAPQLEKAQPNSFKIVICGGPTPPNKESYHKIIYFTGRVDEVVPWMKKADICIAPIFSGSGTRLKIIEYFTSSPVVSTAKGAEGLGITNNKNIVIADKTNFADEVINLCNDAEKSKMIADNALSLVQEKFDWKVIKPLWREALEMIN